MKTKILQLLSFSLLTLMVDCSSDTGNSTGFDSMFDGHTFEGWEGNKEMFRIEDKVIIGGALDKDVPQNEFLCTERKYENFELRLKAKMVGDDENEILNAGIQFRSERIPNHNEVRGYQCDMGEDLDGKIWGFLYDESRRQKFLSKPTGQSMLKHLKKNEWNDFVIRAEGNRIQIWLNEFKTVDYTEKEDSISSTGVICLQIHGGFPAEGWYKDIKIKQL